MVHLFRSNLGFTASVQEARIITEIEAEVGINDMFPNTIDFLIALLKAFLGKLYSFMFHTS